MDIVLPTPDDSTGVLVLGGRALRKSIHPRCSLTTTSAKLPSAMLRSASSTVDNSISRCG